MDSTRYQDRTAKRLDLNIGVWQVDKIKTDQARAVAGTASVFYGFVAMIANIIILVPLYCSVSFDAHSFGQVLPVLNLFSSRILDYRGTVPIVWLSDWTTSFNSPFSSPNIEVSFTSVHSASPIHSRAHTVVTIRLLPPSSSSLVPFSY